MITQRQLRERLYYHPNSGDFVWIKCHRNQPQYIGTQAGTTNTWGYLQITIDGHIYLAAHLAWLYMTGTWPEKGKQIDHRDRVRTNNAWKNLRVVTRMRNQHNRGISKNNTSDVTGLHHNPHKPSCWQTYIRMPDGTTRQTYHKDRDAAIARLEADKADREAMMQALGR